MCSWNRTLPNTPNVGEAESSPRPSARRRARSIGRQRLEEGTFAGYVCTGPIRSVSELANSDGYAWGWSVVQTCDVTGRNSAGTSVTTRLTIAYNHMNRPSVSASTTPTSAGTVLGTVYDLRLPGEPDHLHLGVCRGDLGACEALARGGAVMDSSFSGPMIDSNAIGLFQ
jgi:hypothetical protein